MDIARRKKLKLFITFIDFSKAYDCVPRHKLFLALKRMGCGMTMLMVLIAMYWSTNSIIGTAIVAATVGVRQGSPSSCTLFVFYVNILIDMVKQGSPIDGFLTWLHILVLMDDTILLSTTKDGMINKLKIMHDFCDSYGMILNNGKTKFMVVNGNDNDKEPLVYYDKVINYCKHYIYLGSPFTDDGSPSSAIKMHATIKMCHTLKFISFINKNNDIPFVVKKKIFDAALMSTLLYGCESWLNGNLQPIEKQYKWCIKQLLGVRKTTNNDICLIELGLPPLKSLVRAKQRKFFRKVTQERIELNDDPLLHAINITLSYRDSMSRFVGDLIHNHSDDVNEGLNNLKQTILNSDSNRLSFYKIINPNFRVHEIYLKQLKVNELHRMSWTKLRLSAHSLAVETGRWNRRGRGRLPIEERLCSCGEIQTESHVIESCPMSQQLRQTNNITSLNELLLIRTDFHKVCTIVHNLLELY